MTDPKDPPRATTEQNKFYEAGKVLRLPPRKFNPNQNVEEYDFSDDDYDQDHDIFFLHLNDMDPRFLDRDSSCSEAEGQEKPPEEQLPIDPRTQKPVDVLVRICLDRRGFVNLHKLPKSSLTAEEHRQCLEAISKSRYTAQELLKRFQTKLTDEHKRFDEVASLNYSAKVFLKITTPLSWEPVFVEWWQKQVQRALERAPKLFRLQTALPPKIETPQDVSFRFVHCYNESSFADEEASTKHVREALGIVQKRVFFEKFHEFLEANASFYDDCKEKCLFGADIVADRNSLVKLLTGFHLGFSEWKMRLDIEETEGRNVLKLECLPPREMPSNQRIEQFNAGCLKGAFLNHVFEHLEEELHPKLKTDPEFRPVSFDEYLERFEEVSRQKRKPPRWFKMNVTEIGRARHWRLGLLREFADNVSVKVDYQPDFGASQMLLHELISEWVLLQFTDLSIVTRYRVDLECRNQLQFRKVTLNEVNWDIHRLYGVSGKLLLSFLCQVFEMFEAFPAGHYLLSYCSSKSHLISVYREESEVSDAVLLNLQEHYKDAKFERPCLEEIKHVPIDSLEITPMHLRSQVAPRLFSLWGRRTVLQNVQKRKQPEPYQKPETSKKKKKTKKKRNRKPKVSPKKLPKSDPREQSLSYSDLFDQEGHIKLGVSSAGPSEVSLDASQYASEAKEVLPSENH